MTDTSTKATEAFAEALEGIFNFSPYGPPLDDEGFITPLGEIVRGEGVIPNDEIRMRGPERHVLPNKPGWNGVRFWVSVKDRMVMIVKLDAHPCPHLSVWLEGMPVAPDANNEPKTEQVFCRDIPGMYDMPMDKETCLKLAAPYLSKSEADVRDFMMSQARAIGSANAQ